MSLQNPFFLKESIFSNRFKQVLNSSYNEFVEEFFYDWICFALKGEFETTIAYPKILHNLKSGKYNSIIKNLNPDNKQRLYQYFDNMIVDEQNHTNFIDKLLLDTYNKSVSKKTLNLIAHDTKKLIENSNLISLLIRYYVGECYLWTGFYLIYRQTENPEIKKLFHKLVVDESHHNNNIYKFFKLIKNNIDLDSTEFIKNTSNLKYFGISYTVKKLGLSNTNTKKDKWWNELVYNYEWQHNFNEIFLKKCFQLYEVLYPETTFKDFFESINKNELDWIPYRS
jgi:rubrerythrin